MRSTKGVAIYGLVLSLSGALLWGLRSLGSELAPSTITNPARSTVNLHGSALFHVLLALLVVIVASRLVGMLFRRFQQPPVIGEVVAGILLGPSLLGRYLPQVTGLRVSAERSRR